MTCTRRLLRWKRPADEARRPSKKGNNKKLWVDGHSLADAAIANRRELKTLGKRQLRRKHRQKMEAAGYGYATAPSFFH
jgi:hypothetical protein